MKIRLLKWLTGDSLWDIPFCLADQLFICLRCSCFLNFDFWIFMQKMPAVLFCFFEMPAIELNSFPIILLTRCIICPYNPSCSFQVMNVLAVQLYIYAQRRYASYFDNHILKWNFIHDYFGSGSTSGSVFLNQSTHCVLTKKTSLLSHWHLSSCFWLLLLDYMYHVLPITLLWTENY